MRRYPGVAAAALAATLLVTGAAAAADQLDVMVPANPGGGWDSTGRAVLNALQQAGIYTGPTQVINKGGAAGTIGLAEFVNRFRGDDSAMIVMGSVMVGGILTNKTPVTLEQVTPLARLTIENNAIAVPNNSPFRTVKDFVDALKKDPGALAVGGGSAGGVDHIALALIAQEANVPVEKLNYVPYQGGGEMIAAVAGGKLQAAISGVSEFKQYAEAGRLRILATTGEKPEQGLKAPTLTSQGVNVVIGNWRGVVGPPGMSPAGQERLVTMLRKLHDSKPWRETLKRQGWDDAFLAGEEFGQFLKKENQRVAVVLKDVGLVK